MSGTYTTIEGDVLDQIALAKLGSELRTIDLLEANPQLRDQPAILPRGLTITIPDLPEETTAGTIRLWGTSA